MHFIMLQFSIRTSNNIQVHSANIQSSLSYLDGHVTRYLLCCFILYILSTIEIESRDRPDVRDSTVVTILYFIMGSVVSRRGPVPEVDCFGFFRSSFKCQIYVSIKCYLRFRVEWWVIRFDNRYRVRTLFLHWSETATACVGFINFYCKK